MSCPSTNDWDLLAMETLDEQAAAPLLVHLRECPDCQSVHEQARRSHLDRIRMYDQLDRGHDSLREQLMAALPSQPARTRADRLVRGWRHTGGFTMSIKHKLGAHATIGLLSAAACIAFVALLMTFSGGKNAFAAAIEQFRNARTITCNITTTTKLPAQITTVMQTGKLYLSAEYGSRCDMFMNGVPMVIQYAPLQGSSTSVTPATRTYTVTDTQAVDNGVPQGNGPDSLIRMIAHMQEQANRELGRKYIDGIETLGYEIVGQLLGAGAGEGLRSELWIDAKTYLPVRCIAEMPIGQTGGTSELIYDQFEWDTPLDATLFVPEIPADYTRINATMPIPDEAALIKALRNYAELADKYPPTMDPASILTDLSYIRGRRAASAAARGEKAMDQQVSMQKSAEIGSGFKFYQTLTTPEYYGKTVIPGQADAVLLRWKLTDGQWRVIYGDLRVETINAQ